MCKENSEWTKPSLTCICPGCTQWTEWQDWTDCDCAAREQSRERTCSDSINTGEGCPAPTTLTDYQQCGLLKSETDTK